MPTVLLVEDETEIREIERDYLNQSGYAVIEAADGQQALDRFADHPIDAVVLDLNLPVVDGITVCHAIREQSDVPVIMVTAKTGEMDELLGLKVGADDYVKKPFSPKVLVARVQNLLKRPHLVQDETKLVQGEIEINVDKKLVLRQGRPVDLTSTQFNILHLLMSHPGRVFGREELIARGYGKNLPPDIYDRTIDSHIKNLRKAIEDNAKNPKLIQTVRGHGYRFVSR